MSNPGSLVECAKMQDLVAQYDWSTTPLGDIATWPQSLQTAVSILLASRYAMWMGWGPDLTFIYNDAYGKMTLGKKHPWALGKPANAVWSEVWSDLFLRARIVLEKAEATWDECLLLFLERSGFTEETYHTFSYSPLFADDRTVSGLFCVVTEETERVLSERQLASLRDLAESLGNATNEQAVFTSLKSSLARCNRDLPFTLTYIFDESPMHAHLGCTTGFSSEHPMAPALLTSEEAGSPWPLDQILARRTVMLINLPSSLPTGAWSEPPVRAALVPILRRGEQSLAGFLVAGLNRYRQWDTNYSGYIDLIAGQIAGSLANAQAYEQERRRAEILAELDRAKTTFFSNVSHELRTPLTLILAPLEDELQRAMTSGSDVSSLKLIHRNALRLLKLVNTLLEFSRVQAGRIKAEFRPVDLATLTADLASTFRAAIEKAGLALVVDCQPIDDALFVDPEMWEKIVLNLVSNAFKSTFEGSITVGLRPAMGTAILEVRDTGTGIPAAEIPHLFERFRRVEGARQRTHEGTGIGLALVDELVKMHGGTIAVETTLNQGTCFSVSIPIGSAHLPKNLIHSSQQPLERGHNTYVQEAESWLPEFDDSANLETPSVGFLGQQPDAAQLASILLVDDNRDMREYVRSLLATRFDVRVAENGRIALQLAMQETPDLILSDVMMPEMDGFELLATVRKRPELHNTPVILLSARAGEESRIEGMESGADDYLTKPFTARELLARVQAHVSMAKVRKEALHRERELLAQTEAERSRLQTLFYQAPALIAVLSGPEHRFKLANSMYLHTIGRSSMDDLLNKPLMHVLPELAGQGILELLDEVYRSGEPYIGNELLVRLSRTGTSQLDDVYFNFVYQPWCTVDGSIEGVFVHAVDVTEGVLARKTVERLAASVQASESKLRAILQQVVSGICQVNRSQRFEFVNDRFGDIAGRERGNLNAYKLMDLVHPEDRETSEHIFHEVLMRGVTSEVVHRWIRPDGLEVWVQQNLSPVTDENGNVQSVVCVAQDVTGRKLAEEALRKTEKLAAVGQLASSIAHEINNPLEAVTNLLYLIRNSETIEESQRYTDQATQELSRVSHVVTSTLRFHCQPSAVSSEQLPALLESAVMLYKARMASSEIVLICEFEPSPSLRCFGSELRQVFSNLLANAFDATRDAPIRKIWLRVRPSSLPGIGDCIRLTVADTGKGMDKNTLRRAFEPFFTTKGVHGSGLGLWLSLDILNKHGAKLKIRSQPGRGTVFSVVFPVSAVGAQSPATSSQATSIHM